MYSLPAIRSKGLARKLALMAIEQVREMGFKRCYLETTAFLKEATALYEHLGFEHTDHALGHTGHVDCGVRILCKLWKGAREFRLADIRTLAMYFLSMLDVMQMPYPDYKSTRLQELPGPEMRSASGNATFVVNA